MSYSVMIDWTSIVRQIQDKEDIVKVATELGVRVTEGRKNPGMAFCPFHMDKTPSFALYRGKSERPHYYCFGCGAYGDVVKLYSEIKRTNRVDAIRELANRNGIKISKYPKAISQESHESAYDQFLEFLVASEKADIEPFAEHRGFDPGFLTNAEVFVADQGRWVDEISGDGPLLSAAIEAKLLKPVSESKRSLLHGAAQPTFNGKRAVFVVRNSQGAVAGFIARSIDGDGPKYRNYGNFGGAGVLYRADRVFKRALDAEPGIFNVYLVEGPIDALRLEALGLLAVAALGNKLTKAQTQILVQLAERLQERGCRLQVHIFFDTDGPGLKGAAAALRTLLPIAAGEAPFSVDIIRPDNVDPTGPTSKGDPDELLRHFAQSTEPLHQQLADWNRSATDALVADRLAVPVESVQETWRRVSAGRQAAIKQYFSTVFGSAWSSILERVEPFTATLRSRGDQEATGDIQAAVTKYLQAGTAAAPGKSPVRVDRDNLLRLRNAFEVARSSSERREYPIDWQGWQRISLAYDAFTPILTQHLAEADVQRGTMLPLAARYIPRDDGRPRLKAGPMAEDAILQQYLLSEILRVQDDDGVFHQKVPAVRYWGAESAEDEPRTVTGLDEFVPTNREVVSFAYQIDMGLVERTVETRREGMFRPYYQCWQEYLNFVRGKILRMTGRFVYGVRLDIRSFYDQLPRHVVESVLRRSLNRAFSSTQNAQAVAPLFQNKVEDNAARANLVTDWLLNQSFNYRYVDPGSGQEERWRDRDRGIPQGPDLSAYLANIALFPVDKKAVDLIAKEQGDSGTVKAAYARYVDDIIIVSSSSRLLDRLVGTVTRAVGDRGLQLNEKSKVAHPMSRDEALGWLGYQRAAGLFTYGGGNDPPVVVGTQSPMLLGLVPGDIDRQEALGLLFDPYLDDPRSDEQEVLRQLKKACQAEDLRYYDLANVSRRIWRLIARDLLIDGGNPGAVVQLYEKYWYKDLDIRQPDFTVNPDEDPKHARLRRALYRARDSLVALEGLERFLFNRLDRRSGGSEEVARSFAEDQFRLAHLVLRKGGIAHILISQVKEDCKKVGDPELFTGMLRLMELHIHTLAGEVLARREDKNSASLSQIQLEDENTSIDRLWLHRRYRIGAAASLRQLPPPMLRPGDRGFQPADLGSVLNLLHEAIGRLGAYRENNGGIYGALEPVAGYLQDHLSGLLADGGPDPTDATVRRAVYVTARFACADDSPGEQSWNEQLGEDIALIAKGFLNTLDGVSHCIPELVQNRTWALLPSLDETIGANRLARMTVLPVPQGVGPAPIFFWEKASDNSSDDGRPEYARGSVPVSYIIALVPKELIDHDSGGVGVPFLFPMYEAEKASGFAPDDEEYSGNSLFKVFRWNLGSDPIFLLHEETPEEQSRSENGEQQDLDRKVQELRGVYQSLYGELRHLHERGEQARPARAPLPLGTQIYRREDGTWGLFGALIDRDRLGASAFVRLADKGLIARTIHADGADLWRLGWALADAMDYRFALSTNEVDRGTAEPIRGVELAESWPAQTILIRAFQMFAGRGRQRARNDGTLPPSIERMLGHLKRFSEVSTIEEKKPIALLATLERRAMALRMLEDDNLQIPGSAIHALVRLARGCVSGGDALGTLLPVKGAPTLALGTERRPAKAWFTLAARVGALQQAGDGADRPTEVLRTGLELAGYTRWLRALALDLLDPADSEIRTFLVKSAPNLVEIGLPDDAMLIDPGIATGRGPFTPGEQVGLLFRLLADILFPADAESLEQAAVDTGDPDAEKRRRLARHDLDSVTPLGWLVLLAARIGAFSSGVSRRFEIPKTLLTSTKSRQQLRAAAQVLSTTQVAGQTGAKHTSDAELDWPWGDFIGAVRAWREDGAQALKLLSDIESAFGLTVHRRSGVFSTDVVDREERLYDLRLGGAPEQLIWWRIDSDSPGRASRRHVETHLRDGAATYVWSECRRKNVVISVGVAYDDLANLAAFELDTDPEISPGPGSEDPTGRLVANDIGTEAIEPQASLPLPGDAPDVTPAVGDPLTADEGAEPEVAPEAQESEEGGQEPPAPTEGARTDGAGTGGRNPSGAGTDDGGRPGESWSHVPNKLPNQLRVALLQWEVDETYSHPLEEICRKPEVQAVAESPKVPEDQTGDLGEKQDASGGGEELPDFPAKRDDFPKWSKSRNAISCAETRRRNILYVALKACKEFKVDVLVLPEYSVRPETVAWLRKKIMGEKTAYPLAIWAGTFRLLPEHGPFVSDEELGGEEKYTLRERLAELGMGPYSAVLPAILANGEVFARSKKYPANTSFEFFSPWGDEINPLVENYLSLMAGEDKAKFFNDLVHRRPTSIGAYTKDKYLDGLQSVALLSHILEFICAEVFPYASPANMYGAAYEVAELERRLGKPDGSKTDSIDRYLEMVKEDLKALARNAGFTRSPRRSVMIVPAMSSRSIDYALFGQSNYLAAAMTTVFCNAVLSGYGNGGSCFIGQDCTHDKRHSPSELSPYHGVAPGIFRPGEKGFGQLGEKEQAMVIADIDPVMSGEFKPRPQFLPWALRLVAHLPIVESYKYTAKNPEKDKLCRCSRGEKNGKEKCIVDEDGKKTKQSFRDWRDVIDEVGREFTKCVKVEDGGKKSKEDGGVVIKNTGAILGAQNSAKILQCAQEVLSNLEHAAENSPWMKRRRKAFMEHHAKEPQPMAGQLPPALSHWLYVDHDHISHRRIEKDYISVPPWCAHALKTDPES